MSGRVIALALLLLATLALAVQQARAEPHFAVQEGLKCAQCHVNPAGGGLRTPFGNAWARNTLAAEPAGDDAWTGTVNRFLATGGNLRSNATYTDIPNRDNRSDFELQELRLYLDFTPLPQRLGVYIDQQFAPGGGTNREAFVRYTFNDSRWTLQAGQFYLPHGLRLEDDGAFVRQVPGINFRTPDRGVQLGWEHDAWSTQLAVSNGTAGAPDPGRGKQFSLRTEHVNARWRLGGSFNFNDTETGPRRMQNLFAGLRTGPVAWLGQVEHINDASLVDARRRQLIGLIEANWTMQRGHGLKLTVEYLDPDTDIDENERNRYSLVWEYTPIPFMQLRTGLRVYDGIPQDDLQNRRHAFVQLHGFF